VISKVVKALDLQVQRIQTQTILLEEAQKVVENAMSTLQLDVGQAHVSECFFQLLLGFDDRDIVVFAGDRASVM
jgi:hypothetical protein